MVQFNLFLDEEHLLKIERYQKEWKLSKHDVIRRMITEYKKGVVDEKNE